MPTDFPGAVDSFSTKVDGVDDVMAVDVNDLQDAVVAIEEFVIATAPNPNLLVHTLSHDIWQGGVAFNDFSDDTYGPDQWNMLHNGQAPDVAGVAATGSFIDVPRFLQCTFDSANSQVGFVQFLEYQDALALRGKTLSLSFDCEDVNVFNIRAAILGWRGTADVLISDVVATWQAGNPVLATNWAYLSEGGSPIDHAMSGSLARITIENTAIPAGSPYYNNLAVFIWTPGLEGSGDVLRLARVKLEIGPKATGFVNNPFPQELGRCKRYFQLVSGSGHGATTAIASIGYDFEPQMRIIPHTISAPAVVSIWDGSTGTFTQSSVNIAGSTDVGSVRGRICDLGNFTGLTTGRAYEQYRSTPASFSARL